MYDVRNNVSKHKGVIYLDLNVMLPKIYVKTSILQNVNYC